MISQINPKTAGRVFRPLALHFHLHRIRLRLLHLHSR